MKAWVVDRPDEIVRHPLRLTELPDPEPGPGEVLVRVLVCGVCRTDLHLCEGDLRPKRPGIAPGHQVVGQVVACGTSTSRLGVGDRVGVAWLRNTCGKCRWCRAGEENLCRESTYTGWDDHGGFAELVLVPEAFAYRLPAGYTDEELAPLLCAGIIGYRSLKRANLPAGGRLGIYGFGSAAHLITQLAQAQGAQVFVMSRGAKNRELARSLRPVFVGDEAATPPVQLDSAIIFAPAGNLVPVALDALCPGGTLALAGIHMSAIPSLDYAKDLFDERDLRTVTSNTRADGEEFLRLVERIHLDVRTTVYPFDSVDRALEDLKAGEYSGSGVISVAAGPSATGTSLPPLRDGSPAAEGGNQTAHDQTAHDQTTNEESP